MQITKPCVALVASPGMGHLIPIIELGKRLVTCHKMDVTIFVVTSSGVSSLSQASSQNLLNIVFLPPVDISGLVDSATSIYTQLAIMMRLALPNLQTAISAMESHPVALIVDLFGTELLVLGGEFKMLKYIFVTSNAWYLALNTYVPTLDKNALDKHVENQEPLWIPGCQSILFDDTFGPILNRKNQMFVEFVRVGIEISMADGVLVNTWQDLEPTTLDALGDEKKLKRVIKAPVYAVGPLVRPIDVNVRRDALDWLDMQPSQSVIYVSFGSGGTLSTKQTIELAWGLELSQQRFIWVLRPPVENDASANIFKTGREFDDSSSYLPDGFLTRTHNLGLVISTWAPQTEILAHPSVGGFLSHCGWNSILESIVNGLPIISWPLYAEQKMNAALLTALGVAVRAQASPSNGVVTREEINSMVRRIMVDKEGYEIRRKVKEFKYSALKASSEDGSSSNSISNLAKAFKDRSQCQNVEY
ncbi:hypothetical protein SADUNF_Sadunf07G0026700 [Salix dunnii]|uniref:Glycosyltransferase n=1 Tax=Salix dunnii TaxID=1413687 RepID=A0A835K4E4_9ROSI|nr:hypothetical protein SADUNF_Sadunf07G0026700 [Salix dunnii]